MGHICKTFPHWIFYNKKIKFICFIILFAFAAGRLPAITSVGAWVGAPDWASQRALRWNGRCPPLLYPDHILQQLQQPSGKDSHSHHTRNSHQHACMFLLFFQAMISQIKPPVSLNINRLVQRGITIIGKGVISVCWVCHI